MSTLLGTGAANTWQSGSEFIRESGISDDSDVSTVLPPSRMHSLPQKMIYFIGLSRIRCHEGVFDDRA